MTSSGAHGRAQYVELRLALESLAVFYVVYMFLVPFMAQMFFANRSGALLALVAVATAGVVWALRRRWHALRRRWDFLTGWAERPLRREGALVIQQDANGNEIGRIDTSDRYSVNWERFDEQRAVYLITQREQRVTVSTLAPDAEEFILDAFRIRNYPCVDWPNFDL